MIEYNETEIFLDCFHIKCALKLDLKEMKGCFELNFG